MEERIEEILSGVVSALGMHWVILRVDGLERSHEFVKKRQGAAERRLRAAQSARKTSPKIETSALPGLCARNAPS
jgi:hypothetical protein